MKLRLWFKCANWGVRKGEIYEQRVRWFLLRGMSRATAALSQECLPTGSFSHQNRGLNGNL